MSTSISVGLSELDAPLSRRSFFNRIGDGLYGVALTSIIGQDLFGESRLLASESEEPNTPEARRGYDLQPRHPHYAPKAKSVIQLFMNGGPSQMDLFDPKEELDRNHGKSYFHKIAGEVENPQSAGALMRSPFKFLQHGESGLWVSEVMPHLAQQVDQIAFIRSMFTTNLTHEPAIYKI